MSGTMTTGNWSEFVRGVSARIDEIIDQTKDMGPSFMQYGLHKQHDTDSAIYRTEGVTGLNYTELKTELGALKEDRTYPAYKTEYVPQGHGKIVSISQKLAYTRVKELEDKLDEIKQLKIAANRTLDKWAWMPIVDGYVTSDSNSNFPTARLSDGVSLFSSAHPSRVSGVSNRSNNVSGNPALTPDNLFTTEKMITEQLNGRGLPINYNGGFILVVPPALKKTAMQILESELESGTTDNDINYFKGIGHDLIVCNYLGAANGGSDTQWQVFARDVDEKSLRYVKLIEPKIEKEVDFDTKAIRVSVDYDVAFGYSNFEYCVGSQGA